MSLRDNISQRLKESDIAFRADVLLSELTSYGIGGPADLLVLPDNPERMAKALRILADDGMPVFAIGRGTNILAADAGFRGALIRVQDRRFERIGDGRFDIGAAITLDEVVDALAKAGYVGAQGLAGIPGSLGGGIAMNAGAWGYSTGAIVNDVLAFGIDGYPVEIDLGEMFEYRWSKLRGNTVVSSATVVMLGRGDPEALFSQANEYRRRRATTQPLDRKSAGCIFKNPPHDHAGRLIDAAGLKGTSVGGASISDVHANFIVNLGGATAVDVLTLINIATEKVFNEFGIELEPEIIKLGFDR